MSATNTAIQHAPPKRGDLTAIARRIDEVSGAAVELFKHAGSFEREIALAQAMGDLRAMLNPDIMAPVMELMNTDLGFRTDRDPKVTPRDRDGNTVRPYVVEVVRDVVIEAKLRGFHIAGNEFNIISGRFYAAKNGFRRKLTDGKTFPGLANFKDHYEVPRTVGDKGAIVKCRAEWSLNGSKDSLECEVPVKVNSFMGADAILGKAERKLLKRVVDRLSGVNTPEGEVGDEPPAAAPVEVKVTPTPAPADDDQIPGAEVPPVRSTQRTSAARGGTQAASSAGGDSGGAEPPPQASAAPQPPAPSPQLLLIRRQLAREGLPESAAMECVHRMFPEAGGCNTLEEVEEMLPNVINAVVRGWKSFVAAIRAEGRPTGGVE